MGGRNLILIAVAVVVGLVAVVLANAYFSGLESQQEREAAERQLARIVVATQPLAFGDPLTPDNVTMRNWPANSVPQGAFNDQQVALQGGRVALRPIVPGEPILADKVSGTDGRAVLSANLPEGMRAYSIPVTAVSSVSGFVRPGDAVDVILTRQIPGDGAGEGDLMSDVILEAVQVLAIDQVANEKSTAPQVGQTATVLVDQFQAQKLSLAVRMGSMSLALRNVENQLAGAGTTVTSRDVGNSNLYLASRERSSAPPPAAEPRVVYRDAPRSAPVSTAATPARPAGPTMTIYRGTDSTDYSVGRLGGR